MANTKITAALAVTGAAAALYAGAHHLIDRVMVSMALDREKPFIMEKAMSLVSGGSVDQGFRETAAKKRDEILEEAHEEVEIESHDGLKLVGHLFRRENAGRVIVAMHGWRSRWYYDFSAIWDFWKEEGATVLCPEERGQGGSGGDYMGFGLLERYDCLEWVKWAAENVAGDLPIYLAGVSMGASTVLMTAGFEDLPENVRGIIADCGFTSPKEEFRHVTVSNLRLPYATHERATDRLFKKRIGVPTDAYSAKEAMKTNTRPILFIHGTDDHFVPARMSEENYAACKAPKELLLVQGADHARSYLAEKERYEEAVRAFFEKYDHR